MTIDKFLNAISLAARELVTYRPDLVVVIHHNDADGISSGAIVTRALERAQFRLQRYCLEKPYPAVIEAIFDRTQERGRVAFVFCDFASGMISTLARLNTRGDLILILDHHVVEQGSDAGIRVVNCRSFGIDGSRECSASTIAYLFAREITPFHDDLALPGVVGTVGDGFVDAGGCPYGFAERVVSAALQSGRLHRHEKHLIAQYAPPLPLPDVCQVLNALGSFGYFTGGVDVGVKAVVEDLPEAARERARDYTKQYQSALDTWLTPGRINRIGKLQWFRLDSSFSRFGVKTVGLVCEEIIRRGLVDPECYLIGLQEVPDTVPGIGPINLAQTKISMRMPEQLWAKVGEGAAKNCAEALGAAARAVNGFTDALHPHAAAVTIARTAETEERFIKACAGGLAPTAPNPIDDIY